MKIVDSKFMVSATISSGSNYTETIDGILWHWGVWYLGFWINGVWESGLWHTGVWINGSWVTGDLKNIDDTPSYFFLRSMPFSPKSYFKPKLTISLNYAKYK